MDNAKINAFLLKKMGCIIGLKEIIIFIQDFDWFMIVMYRNIRL